VSYGAGIAMGLLRFLEQVQSGFLSDSSIVWAYIRHCLGFRNRTPTLTPTLTLTRHCLGYRTLTLTLTLTLT
jgi:hypothetical protein